MRRPEHRYVILHKQACIAAGLVAGMIGGQDRGELQAFVRQVFVYRIGISAVHHDGR